MSTQSDHNYQPTGTFLAVDLDGTLHAGDFAMICVKQLIRRRPWEIARILWWFRKGHLELKLHLAKRVTIDMNTLAWNEELIEFIKQQTDTTTILATAAVPAITQAVVAHLQNQYELKFDHVISSSATVNLIGKQKAAALLQLCKQTKRGFDYVGDSETQDPPVFALAQKCHFVDPTPSLLAKFQSPDSKIFRTNSSWTRTLRKRLLHLVQAKGTK